MRAWIRSFAALAAVIAAPTLSAQATSPAKAATAAPAPAAAKTATAGSSKSAPSAAQQTKPATAPSAAQQTKPATASSAAQQTKPATAAAAKPPMVDINKATEAELEALPGIGKALAPKIIAGRPYAKKSDLVSKKILTQATYDKVKGHIVAHQ